MVARDATWLMGGGSYCRVPSLTRLDRGRGVVVASVMAVFVYLFLFLFVVVPSNLAIVLLPCPSSRLPPCSPAAGSVLNTKSPPPTLPITVTSPPTTLAFPAGVLGLHGLETAASAQGWLHPWREEGGLHSLQEGYITTH